MKFRALLLVGVWLLLSGCSSMPAAIRGDFSASPSLPGVQASLEQWRGQRVRWGGQVARVKNRATETWVEVVARRLDADGLPGGPSQGRFFAVFKGFLDPAHFTPGRELTVVGRVKDLVVEKIGDYPYQFPVVSVEAYHLWPPPRPAAEIPYWYDPWYPFLYPPWYY
jgi:outer membrane lipoprotein